MMLGPIMTLVVVSTTLSPTLPASYQIDARLDTSAHKIRAVERVVFLNPTGDSLEQVCFHLYPNAFRDTSSVFARKDAHSREHILFSGKSELIISNIIIDGVNLDPGAVTESGTLLYLAVPSPLAPRDTVVISLDFELTIPGRGLRLGYSERGNYILSHWHPILCGYQGGRLVDNEYYPLSEFFSNFSNYDVRLEIPPDFSVGATGKLALIEKDSSRSVWRAVADTVIDFAFACGPAFEVFESDTLGFNLRYMLSRENRKFLQAVDNATKYSLAYCSERLLKYPYSTFTLVDSEIGAQGMELPQMNVITFPGGGMISTAEPILWFIIAHEVAHEWFYGTIASNEAEEPWLDEGLSTYMAARIMELQPDSLKSILILGYPIPINTLDRLFAMMSKAEWPSNMKSWDYPDDFSYSAAVYFRASAMLQTLEQMVGRAAFDSALKDYANRYRFGHPRAEEFQNALEKSLGIDLNSFFEQFIAGTARVDYAIRNVEYKSIAKSNAASIAEYNITVTVGREYEGILPQKIEIGLKNRTVIDTLWDGIARTAIFEFNANSRPEYARIGYGGGPYALDENAANNSIYLKSFGSRLLIFEWDTVFALELLLALLL